MRSKLIFCSIIIAVFLSGCNEYCDDNYKPSDCNENKPAEGDLTLEITIDNLNPEVPVEFYIGDVEENGFYFADTITVGEITYKLPNNYYSVKAKYKAVIDGRTVTVYSIDGGSLIPVTNEYCDGTCYDTGRLNLNAKLEF